MSTTRQMQLQSACGKERDISWMPLSMFASKLLISNHVACKADFEVRFEALPTTHSKTISCVYGLAAVLRYLGIVHAGKNAMTLHTCNERTKLNSRSNLKRQHRACDVQTIEDCWSTSCSRPQRCKSNLECRPPPRVDRPVNGIANSLVV